MTSGTGENLIVPNPNPGSKWKGMFAGRNDDVRENNAIFSKTPFSQRRHFAQRGE
jgi:hypothetical protein